VVTGTNSFLDEIAAMIAQRRQKMQGLVSELNSLEAEVAALQQAETLYKNEHSISEGVDPSELKGKSQLSAMILIAQRNDGILNMVEAKRKLIQAGVAKNSKNTLSILYNVLGRSDRFEKVSPGVYRLRENRPAAYENVNRPALPAIISNGQSGLK
jgi:hypothetical protein